MVLLRVPQGIALLGQDRALEAGRAHPGLPLVVGGHSLGGVVAAGVAAREGLPLVLFAAYPEEDLSQEAFPTLALYGTEDGLLPQRRPEGRRKGFPETPGWSSWRG